MSDRLEGKLYPNIHTKGQNVFVNFDLLSIALIPRVPIEIQTPAGRFEHSYKQLHKHPVSKDKSETREFLGHLLEIETVQGDESYMMVFAFTSPPIGEEVKGCSIIRRVVRDRSKNIIETFVLLKENSLVSVEFNVANDDGEGNFEVTYWFNPQTSTLEPKLFDKETISTAALRIFLNSGFPLSLTVPQALQIAEAALNIENRDAVLPGGPIVTKYKSPLNPQS